MAIKYTNIARQIPNNHKMHQMLHPKDFQNIAKLAFLVRKNIASGSPGASHGCAVAWLAVNGVALHTDCSQLVDAV
jgi:hypothetical protein